MNTWISNVTEMIENPKVLITYDQILKTVVKEISDWLKWEKHHIRYKYLTCLEKIGGEASSSSEKYAAPARSVNIPSRDRIAPAQRPRATANGTSALFCQRNIVILDTDDLVFRTGKPAKKAAKSVWLSRK